MKTELKTSLSFKKTLLILSLLCLLLGALCLALGELLLPVSAALLAVIYVFDTTERRIFSYAVSAALILINIAGLIFGITLSLFSIQAVIIALLICLSFRNGASKSDSSYLLTLICVAFIVLEGLLLAMAEVGEYTVDAAVSFYANLFDQLRAVFVNISLDMYGEIFAKAGVKLTSDVLETMFDAQLGLIISYLVIAAFCIVGITMKLFTAFSAKLAQDNRAILSWRFVTSNVFAYFYIILLIASIFTTSASGVFALTVNNLYNIFMAIYAYVGFNFAIAFLSSRMRPMFAFLIICIALLTFFSFGISLLAMIGVIFTLRINNGPHPVEK